METATPKKILTFPIRIALIIMLYGLLFIKMSWPYGHMLLFIGTVILTVLYLIRFLNKRTKARVDYVKLSIVLIWFFGLFGTVFNWFHITDIIEIILIILTIWWLIEEGFSYFINRKLVNNSVLRGSYYVLAFASIGSICVGYIFKIQHWPFGNLMFTLGVLLLSILILLDHFVIKRKPTDS